MELPRPGGPGRPGGRLRRPGLPAADLPAGRPARQPDRPRAAGPRPGPRRRGHAVLRELGRGLPDQDRRGQGRAGGRADQPDDGPGHGLGHDPAGRAQARDRGRGVLAAPPRGRSRPPGLEVAVTITIGGGPVPGSVSFTDFVAGPAGHRAGRRDPRRRHLGAAVHLGHHRAAQGRDDLAHLQLHGRLRVRAVADPRPAHRVRAAGRHVPADALPRRRPALHLLGVPVRRHPHPGPQAGPGPRSPR